jgi:hypothetical protein
MRRPTLLIGYDHYGLEILRRLLTATVFRGVLDWEDASKKASDSERYIQDLALLWMKNPASATQPDDSDVYEGRALEMMRDLYRQIQPIQLDSTEPEIKLSEAVCDAVEKKLLSPSARSSSSKGAVFPGLDAIVIVHLADSDGVGFLKRVLPPAMKKLVGSNVNLQTGVQSASAVNFILILDFDNYWDSSEEGRRLREALNLFVAFWQKEQQRGRPSFQRIYLTDGRAANPAFRDKPFRIDEIALFLEFLLFEGQRAGDLQRLYQSQGAHESPVAGFGVRLFERSSELLSRLSAAKFGIHWLDYLASHDHGVDAEPTTLRQKLAPYKPKTLEQELGQLRLSQMLENGFASLEKDLIEQELTEAKLASPDWHETLSQRYQAESERLENEMSAHVHAQFNAISENYLDKLTEDLRQGIQSDLHDSMRPAPLGAVIQEIETALHELESKHEALEPTSVADKSEPLENAKRLHAQYKRFADNRLNLSGVKEWWIWFSLFLALGLTPIVEEWFENVQFLDNASLAYKLLINPIAISLILFLAFWLLATLLIHRRVKKDIERANASWINKEKGIFADYIRRNLKPNGKLREPLEQFQQRLLNDMALSVRTEVRRELGRAVDILKRRKKEMDWLRGQLEEFLNMNGVMATQHGQRHDESMPTSTDVRFSEKRKQDFDKIRQYQPTIEDFRFVQGQLKPFEGWDGYFSKFFLYPLNFIDILSEALDHSGRDILGYSDNGRDLAYNPRQALLAKEFIEFLNQRGSLDLSFTWKPQEGIPPRQRYCLLPNAWRQLSEALPSLTDKGITEKNTLQCNDESRAYLLCALTGISPDCLIGKSS